MPPQPAPTHSVLPILRQIIVNGSPQTVLETLTGQRIILQQTPAAVLIEDANGNTIRLDASGITIHSASAVTIQSSTVNIDAALTTVTGVLRAEAIEATSVAATTITPGAGNVW